MPTVVSTFAGCGGSSLGYRMAGYRELLAIDFDSNAEATFNKNFPEVPFWNRDIKGVSGKEIMEFCKIKKGDLGVLDGSPPCQGFSPAGKRRINDARNDLFKEFVRLVNETGPKVFVMENVYGMCRGKMKGRFKEIMRLLKSTGYNVRCKLLNAMYYGVPQSRQRLFFIGFRADLGKEPVFPKPSSRIIVIAKALENVELGDEDTTFQGKNRFLMRETPPGKSAYVVHPKKHMFNFVRLDYSKPGRTILKTMGRSWAGLAHPTEDRMLTIPELKRLASFPDDFVLVGNHKAQWARIGNAVMPKQMEAVAKAIKAEVFA